MQGILEVAGELSGGSGGHIAGHTARYYATIKLESNAEIDVNGELKVTGFIEEADGSTNSLITVHNGATIYEPLVIRDFKGGSLMTAIYNSMSGNYYSPFNQYTVMNVSVTLRINYGGTMANYCNLQAQDNVHSTMGRMIGVGGLIELTDASYSYLISKYNPDTGVTKLDIYGGARCNAMELVVLGNPISSKNFNLAIPWIYDITLSKSPYQTTTAKFSMPHRYKLMPGSKLTVEQGAELSVNWMVVYTEFIDTVTDGTNSPGWYYTYNPVTKEVLDEAKLIVRGTLIASTLGGKVYTDTAGAKVKVTGKTQNVESKEPTEYYSLSFASFISNSQTISKSLELLVINQGSTGSISGITYNGMEYYTSAESGNIKWNVPDYFEITVGEGYTITTSEWLIVDSNGNVTLTTGDTSTTFTAGETLYLKPGANVTYTVDDGYVIFKGTSASYDDVGDDYSGIIYGPLLVKKVTFIIDLNLGDGTREYTITLVDENDDGICEVELEFTGKIGKDGELSVEVQGDGSQVTYNYDGDIEGILSDDETKYTITYDKKDSGKEVGILARINPGENTTISLKFVKGEIDNGCVTPETLVTLADGTQKEIQYVTYDDMLLVWDFVNGKYVEMPAIVIRNHGYDNYRVLKLTFSDGTTVDVISEHGFFDVDLNEFVMIGEDNVADYIGHRFVKANGDFTTVTLESYSVREEYTAAYSILTAIHYNCIMGEMFTLTPNVIGGNYFMPFEVGENMKFDEVKMQNDIEKYGLFTYEEFADVVTVEQFYALNAPYVKVAVGKGIITMDDLYRIIEELIPKE